MQEIFKRKSHITSARDNVVMLVMTVCALALLTMFLGSIILSYHIVRTEMTSYVTNLTTATRKSTEQAIINNDAKEAQRLLNTLGNVSSIIYAELKHADGEVLAAYQRSDYRPSYLGNLITAPISAQQSIASNNQHLASLTLTSNTEPLILHLTILSIGMLAVGIGSILVALLAAQALQRRISSPLQTLKTAINRASLGVDGHIQLPVDSKDELGGLLNDFNLMMTRFSEQHESLSSKATNLRDTVDARNQQISEEEKKRILWLQNLARFLKHELKNTMLGFRSSLDMIERRSSDEKISQYIDRARSSVIFMGKLLHNVGETSSLEAELLEEDYDVIDLSTVISDWLEEYANTTGITNLSLDCDERCFIEGNAIRLKQLAEKLLGNAETHSLPNSNVQVSVERLEQEVTLSIANQGIPLPEDRGGIFDLFVSMRENDQQSDDNIGLGLYIVRLIAEAHDGYVEALDLGEAEGAVFKVHFPIYRPY